MIVELVRELYTSLRQFVGQGTLLTLFAVSVAVIVIAKSGKDKGVVAAILSITGTIGIAASAAYERIVSLKAKRSVKVIVAVFTAALMLLVITSSGGNVFSEEISERAADDMHLPAGLREAMDATLQDCDRPTVLTMPGWGVYLKAYSSKFEPVYDESVYGMSDLGEDAWIVYTELGKVHPDMKKVALHARAMDCRYVILSDGIWPEFPITSFGYEKIFEGSRCSVYREVSTP